MMVSMILRLLCWWLLIFAFIILYSYLFLLLWLQHCLYGVMVLLLCFNILLYDHPKDESHRVLSGNVWTRRWPEAQRPGIHDAIHVSTCLYMVHWCLLACYGLLRLATACYGLLVLVSKAKQGYCALVDKFAPGWRRDHAVTVWMFVNISLRS